MHVQQRLEALRNVTKMAAKPKKTVEKKQCEGAKEELSRGRGGEKGHRACRRVGGIGASMHT